MRQAGTDEVRIQRGFLTGLLLLGSIFLAWFGFARNMPVLGLLIPVVAIASGLISRPASLFILIVFIGRAGFYLPQIPKLLNGPMIFRLLLIGAMLLDVAVRHRKDPQAFRMKPDIWLILFALNMLMIMQVRGAGFAFFGGRTYGAGRYISLFVAIFFYFATIRLRFSDRQVKNLLLLTLLASCIPAMVQLLASVVPAVGGALSMVIQANVEQIIDETVQEEGSISRWSALGPVAYALIPVAYLLIRREKVRYILVGLAALLVAFTGYRSRLVIVGMTAFLCELVFSKNRMRSFFFWGLIGAVGLAVLVAFAPMLPPAVQRTVAFLGIIPIDPDIARSAGWSTDFRLDIWRNYCIPNLPRYLLIGRGISHDISGFAWLQGHWYGGAEFFYYIGNYHSGPFSLLMDFGLAGTVSFTAFFLSVIVDAWKTLRRTAIHLTSFAARYYVYLTLWLTVEVFSFFVIFGDVNTGLGGLLLTAMLLRVLKKNFLTPSGEEMPEGRSQMSGVSSTIQRGGMLHRGHPAIKSQ